MHEYGKTENAFTRNPDTHKLNAGDLRDPAWGQISEWLVTEKVDGTNMRVLLRLADESSITGDGYITDIRGRSDRANLHGDLVANISSVLNANSPNIYGWLHHITNSDPDIIVCLYGEGYGAGIQKCGSQYSPKKAMRIFDVTTTHVDADGQPDGPTWWRGWSDVQLASEATGLKTVPVLSYASTLSNIEDEVAPGFNSAVADEDGGDRTLIAEGVIARTDPYLYDFRGHRVMFKLKTHDLATAA